MTTAELEVHALLQPSLLLMISPAGVVLGVSEEAQALLGWPPQALVGRDLRDIAQLSSDLTDLFPAVQGDRRTGPVAIRLRQADGGELATAGTFSVLSPLDAGPTVGIVCVLNPLPSRTAGVLRTYEAFQRLSQELVVTADVDGTVTWVSPALSQLLGIDVHWDGPCELWDLVHPTDVARVQNDFMNVLATGAPQISTVRVRNGDGSHRWVEVAAANAVESSIGGVVCSLRDITDRVDADKALRASEARFRVIADTAEEGIWALTPSGQTLYANPRMGRILGIADDAPLDLAVLERLDPRAAAEVRRRLATREQRGAERYEIAYAHPDGRQRCLWVSAGTFRNSEGRVEGSLAMVSDITDVRAAEEELRVAALRDTLTGLPNRALLVDRLSHALAKPDSVACVLFIGVDDVKLVNESRGHDVGDQLLIAVAERLLAASRPHDTVARFGGDEFAVVCESTDEAQARTVAEQLSSALAAPLALSAGQTHVTASIGIATGRTGDATPADLLRFADTAMRSAKASGRGRVRVFESELATIVEDEYALVEDLRSALTNQALELHYQPILSLESGLVVGVEALARWNHPGRGAVPPLTFVALAERAGLAAELDRWVLRQALADMGRLRAAEALPPCAFLAVNLSASNLDDMSLDTDALIWAEQAGVQPEQVSLEITETAIMQDTDLAVALLKRLRDQGFRVAVDDFGTGYSSLAYLRDLPITALKIDRAFIADITTSRAARAIVTSVIELGRAIGVTVTAEGVETTAQAELLQQLGCVTGQGWLWSRAVSVADIPALGWATMAAGTEHRGGRTRRRRPPVTNEHGLSRLLELHSVGASHSTIAAALNSDGYRTPEGSRWHAKTVGHVIVNVAYPALRPPEAQED